MSVEVVKVTPIEGAVIDVLGVLAKMIADDPAKVAALSAKLETLKGTYNAKDGLGGAFVVVDELQRIIEGRSR